MFGINEILYKVFNKKSLSEEEKFRISTSKKIDRKVIKYLISRLSHLSIEILDKYEGTLLDLMHDGKLEGWCWQTTESAIVFFNDEDYIERGYLMFDEETPKYYHSWICFDFDGTEYVLDACLNILCKKDDYYKFYKAEEKGKVTAKSVREELIRHLTLPKKEYNSEAHKSYEEFLKNLLEDNYEMYQEMKKNEVVIDGPEDVNTPFYRNGSGYKAEIEGEKVKKLIVHYYYTDC